MDALSAQIADQMGAMRAENKVRMDQMAAAIAAMRQGQGNQAMGAGPVGAQVPPVGPPPAPPWGLNMMQGVGIDTRLLGQPDNFDKESKWRDWSTVFRA